MIFSYIPANEQDLVRSKWICSTFMLPFGHNDDDDIGSGGCWIDIFTETFLLYLILETDQMISEGVRLGADRVEIDLRLQYSLTKGGSACAAGGHKKGSLLPFKVLRRVGDEEEDARISISCCRGAESSELSIDQQLFALRFDDPANYPSLLALLDNPDSQCRLLANLKFLKDGTPLKGGPKHVFLSENKFRLATTRVVLDASTDLASCNRPINHGPTAFLYDRKEWWNWNPVSMAAPADIARRAVARRSAFLQTSCGASFEDVQPGVFSGDNYLLRVRVASELFARDRSNLALAPFICPQGLPKAAESQDVLELFLLSTSSPQMVHETSIAEQLEIVIDDDTCLTYQKESASFRVPAKFWHQLVPAQFAHRSMISDAAVREQDNEVSLVLQLRLRSCADRLLLHRKEFIPFVRLQWSSSSGPRASDSCPNRQTKLKFDLVAPPSSSEQKKKAAQQEDEQEEVIRPTKEWIQDLRDVPLLRERCNQLEKKIQEAPTPVSKSTSTVATSPIITAAVSSVPPPPPPPQPLPPVLVPTVSTFTNLKADLKEWLRVDHALTRRHDKCISLFTSLVHAIIDEIEKLPWASVTFHTGLIVPRPFQESALKRTRGANSDPAVWKQAKEVFAAWIQECLSFLRQPNLAPNDLESFKDFLRESAGSHPLHPAYNAALRQCLANEFQRFHEFCGKLQGKIDSFVSVYS